jgi:hypothetical protein
MGFLEGDVGTSICTGNVMVRALLLDDDTIANYCQNSAHCPDFLNIFSCGELRLIWLQIDSFQE